MSLINGIRQAGSTAAARFGDDVIDAVKTSGETIVEGAKTIGSTVATGAEKAGSIVAADALAAERFAVKSFQFQANVVRFRAEKSFDNAKKVGSDFVDNLKDAGTKAVDNAKRTSSTAVRALDKVLHPGDPNPPAAQGLKFSETKSASILAYRANKGEVYQFPDGKQWTVVDASQNKKTGFRAVAFQPVDSSDKRTIIAFSGTDPKSGKDWITDAAQGLGFQTAQYREAVDYANKWKSSVGNNAVLTGHSLGGGLASYASIKTGLGATALNSAPLALNHLGGNPLNPRVRNNPNIAQYYVPGEVLTVFDGENLLDVRPGNKIAVQGRYSVLNPLAPLLNHFGESSAPDIATPVRIR